MMKNGTEQRVEGVWGRRDLSPPIVKKCAAEPLLILLSIFYGEYQMTMRWELMSSGLNRTNSDTRRPAL